MINFSEKLVGVVRTIKGSIKPDKDSPKSESVNLFLDIDFSNCTLEDVLGFACADRKIAWAAKGREEIAKYKTGQRVKVSASSPGAKTVDIKADYKAWFASLSAEEQSAELMRLQGK